MINGGVVKYGETRKLAEYENKRADVELNFSTLDGTTPEQGEAEALKVLTVAKNVVKVALGLKPETTVAVSKEPPVADEKPTPRPTKATKATGGKAAKSTGDTPPAVPASDPADISAEVAKPQISVNPENRKDPADMDDAGGEPDLDFLDSGPVAEISDQDLMAEVSKQVQRLVKANGKDAGNKAVREVKEKYAPLPKQTVGIPQSSRRQFLDELAALT